MQEQGLGKGSVSQVMVQTSRNGEKQLVKKQHTISLNFKRQLGLLKKRGSGFPNIYRAEAKIIQQIYPEAKVDLSNEGNFSQMKVSGIPIGVSLDKLSSMSLESIENIVTSLVGCLAFLHGQKGIFHGDIKKENIIEIKGEDGRASYDFCDWGSAGNIRKHNGGDGESGLMINPWRFQQALQEENNIEEALSQSKEIPGSEGMVDIFSLFGCAYQLLEDANILTKDNLQRIFSIDLRAYQAAASAYNEKQKASDAQNNNSSGPSLFTQLSLANNKENQSPKGSPKSFSAYPLPSLSQGESRGKRKTLFGGDDSSGDEGHNPAKKTCVRGANGI